MPLNGTMQLFSFRQIRSARTLLLLLVVIQASLSVLTTPAHAAQVTLAWDPSSGANIAGYKLYWGTTSRNYTENRKVGAVTTFTITNLASGRTYYIAATAYDTHDYESAYSEEVSITFPGNNAPVPGNNAPVAQNGVLDTMQNTSAYGTLRASDENGNTLSYRIVDQAGNGNVVILDPATGEYAYAPNRNATGSDSFTFRVNDGKANSNVATVKVTITPNATTSYENAKDKRISRWTIRDKNPPGAVVRNVYDKKRHSRVIELKGKGTGNAYRLRNADGSKWRNSEQSVLQWSMSYTGKFKLCVDVRTTVGQRFITYTPAAADALGNGRFVYFGIGAGAIPGQWHTFTRDLQADLEKAQPNARILEINGLLIRGNMRIDDMQLLHHLPYLDTDADGISDDEEVHVYASDPLKADTGGCGISDGFKRDYLRAGWDADADGDGIINLLDDDMDNDGFLDGAEIAQGSNPTNSDSVP
jgi:hypothetical protein